MIGIGGAVLFETPTDGVLEIRVLNLDYSGANFLISQVSPRMGIKGGFTDEDPNNSPFSAAELDQIAESIINIKSDLSFSLVGSRVGMGLPF